MVIKVTMVEEDKLEYTTIKIPVREDKNILLLRRILFEKGLNKIPKKIIERAKEIGFKGPSSRSRGALSKGDIIALAMASLEEEFEKNGDN